jgi:hypothetical protein
MEPDPRKTRLLVAAAVLGALLGAGAFAWLADRPAAPPAAPPERTPPDVRRLKAENERLRRELAEARAAVPIAPETGPAPVPPRPAPGVPESLRPPRPAPPPPADPAEAAVRLAAALEGLKKACAAGDRPGIDLYRRVLVGLGSPAVDPLLAFARDAGEGDLLREQALRALVDLRAPDLAALAAGILGDGGAGPLLRAAALAAAANLPGDAALGALVRSLATDGSAADAERAAALRALVGGYPEAAIPVLRACLDGPDGRDRDAAMTALLGARDRALLPLLTETANGPRPPQALGSLLNTIASVKDRPWSAVQLTGEPDTPVDGDHGTAWASKGQDMGEVWLELDFPEAVLPEGIRIRETLNPGAVARVQAKAPNGAWETLWEGTAGEGASPRWFEPPLARASAATRTLRVVLDTNRVGGWNEIDAVELAGGGRAQWASAARASSSYADP